MTVKKIVNCNNINSVNPLYLMNNEIIGRFEEKSGNKYLVLGDLKIKELLKKYEEVSEDVKKEIETINGDKKIEYGKDFQEIRFESDDDLPIRLHP